MDRKPKTIFQLDSPFTKAQWPEVSSHNLDTVLELLCSLLTPLGQHRSHHVLPSRGKRSQKRKRKQVKEKDVKTEAPPSPELSSFLVIGWNNVFRRLEISSQKSKPGYNGTGDEDSDEAAGTQTSAEVDAPMYLDRTKHFSVIFASQSSEVLKEYLPQLVATACLAHPELPPTRLVQLPKEFDIRVCAALRLPRVSCIGLLEMAPHSKALVDLILQSVPAIELLWLKRAQNSAYIPVKINAIETLTPVSTKHAKGI